jgi:hypothetical protein
MPTYIILLAYSSSAVEMMKVSVDTRYHHIDMENVLVPTYYVEMRVL